MAGAKKKAKSAKVGKVRGATPSASRENLETYYREMLTIRRFV